MSLRYALIGCGRIAVNHIAAALAENLDVVGLCDLEIENIHAMLRKAGVSTGYPVYSDYRQMLRETKPELVGIATESGKHAQIALDCIEQGCHVIIEKPIALSLQDADAVIAAGNERGVCVSACHQNRFNLSIQMMRQAIEGGRLGRPLYGTAHIRWNRNEEYYAQAPWRGTWAQDGGALMNQCIHNIDLLRWMMGDEVTEVFAYTERLTHPYIEAEDMGLALTKFANGAYGLIEGSTSVFSKNLEETLYIFGEKGTMKAGGQSVNRIEEWRLGDGLDDAEDVKVRTAENPPDIYGFGHSRLYADVIRAIEMGTKPLADGEAGRRALELVLAIYRSAKEGRPIRLPMASFSTIDMAGYFDES